MKDATCPALHAALQAAEKGVPFMPLRGLIGSDLMTYRDDWNVIDNPFGNDDPIVLLPAIKPDVALFHAPHRGPRRQCLDRPRSASCDHGARLGETIVTVEKIHDGNLLDDPALSAGTLPGFYVETIAVRRARRLAAGAARPLCRATPRILRDTRDGRDGEGFAEYLERHVYEQERGVSSPIPPDGVASRFLSPWGRVKIESPHPRRLRRPPSPASAGVIA